jgi:hypothetical protein
MPKFRKKPVVIEAVQWEPDSDGAPKNAWPPNWPILDWDLAAQWTVGDSGAALIIHTLEGDMRAEPGDWIIKGVKGEFYPCKPDIFAATYEPA